MHVAGSGRARRADPAGHPDQALVGTSRARRSPRRGAKPHASTGTTQSGARNSARNGWTRLPGMQAPRNGGSPLETYLHRALRKAGISFSTQQPATRPLRRGHPRHQKPVVIEADGNMHLHAGPARERRSARRRHAGGRVRGASGSTAARSARMPMAASSQVIEACRADAGRRNPSTTSATGCMAEANPRWKGGKPRVDVRELRREVPLLAAWLRQALHHMQPRMPDRMAAEDESIGREPRPPQRQPDPVHAARRAAEIRQRWEAEDRESR